MLERDFHNTSSLVGRIRIFVREYMPQPFPSSDRQGPPRYRPTAVGLYEWETPKRLSVLQIACNWANRTIL